MDHQPDMRDWSFAKRALAEIQQAKRKNGTAFGCKLSCQTAKNTGINCPKTFSMQCDSTKKSIVKTGF
ncbi:MAG: hypothetical protein ACIRZ6_08255 [Limosilactobacillus mucosae]